MMKDHPFSREAAAGARLNLRESILGRIFLWCLAAALVPLLLVQLVSYFYLESTLRRDAQARINLVGEQKLRLLNLFLDDCEGDLVVLSRTPVLLRALPELTAAAQRGGFASERYRAASQMPFELMRTVVVACGYADALLVSPSGDVLLATTARPELGTNLRTGRYRDTELTRVLEVARSTMRPATSSFRIHPPTGRAAVWLAAPMMQGRALAGFAVVEISREAVTSLTRDYAGLGATGDIWLGEVRDGRLTMFSPTRDNKVLPFQSLPWTGPRSAPLVLASEGRSGSGVMKDFRGVPSIAWWTPLPRLKCGLVVRMDQSEALAALAARRKLALWTALVSVVFALAAAWLAAHSIARPVRALEQGVRRIAGGDWAHRVGHEGHGEIGRLGRSFDQMLDRIKSVTASRDELNGEMEERKTAEAEIRQLNADLEKRVRELTADLEHRTKQLAAAEAEAKAVAARAAGDLVAGLRGRRVLLVENDESNREVTCGLSGDAGLEITVAENGREEVEKVATGIEATPATPARPEETPAATPSIVEETIVEPRETIPAPAAVLASELERVAGESADDPEPEAAIKRRSRSRRASPPIETAESPGEEPPANDSPTADEATETPFDLVEAGVAEEPTAAPEPEERELVEPPEGDETPAKSPVKKAPRVRRAVALSPQQELFAMDAPTAELPVASAPSAPKVPARRFAPAPPAVAPAKASEAPVPPLEVKALRLSLWTLESLLRNDDIDSQAELEALLPQVKGTAFEARFNTLAREIAGYRFESAVAELERIKIDLAG